MPWSILFVFFLLGFVPVGVENKSVYISIYSMCVCKYLESVFFLFVYCRVKSEHTAQKTVESSVATVAMYVENLMDAIFSSVKECPSLLRLALRQLWLRVEERFKDSESVVSAVLRRDVVGVVDGVVEEC